MLSLSHSMGDTKAQHGKAGRTASSARGNKDSYLGQAIPLVAACANML